MAQCGAKRGRGRCSGPGSLPEPTKGAMCLTLLLYRQSSPWLASHIDFDTPIRLLRVLVKDALRGSCGIGTILEGSETDQAEDASRRSQRTANAGTIMRTERLRVLVWQSDEVRLFRR